MLEQRLQQQLFESADQLVQGAEALAGALEPAAQALTVAITGGGRVLVAGTGRATPLAAYMAARLVAGFERERPPLAALALPAQDTEAAVLALGQPGDLLLLIDDGQALDGLAPALVGAAHGKDMAVLALIGAAADWVDALAETDVTVTLPHERRARVLEWQLLCLHALLDALDLQLLGETEST